MLRFKQTKRPGLGIDLTPIVDMVFLLLIFFMLSSSFLQPSIRLELPSGTNTDKEKRQEIIITVDRNENIYVNLEKVTLQTLGLKLQEKMAESGERSVTFRGDRRIRYEIFIKVADIAKSVGATTINAAHQIEGVE
ncbi:MAG: biopolymer transporter ExbD [Planctomycetota bacterium]